MRQRRPLRSSPRRQMINQQLDSHTTRIKQLLQADIAVLQQQNALLKTKCKKLHELQEKVQLVLRQNNQLLAQNQKMSRLLHQHKSENEILKNKLDQQNSQRVGLFGQFEFKEKQLIGQIQHLNAELSQLENIKNLQINELKSQFQIQLQNVKRQHSGAIDVYEQEIRKLKEILDRREIQIGELSNRIKKQSSDFEFELMKFKEERQKLRNQIAYIETDHKKDLQELRVRLDAHYLQEMERLKRQHYTNLQEMERQSLNLKQIIDQLNIENETVRKELEKSTAYYQDTISLLKRQSDDLKLQLIELQKISQSQKADMQNDLAVLHQQQTRELKNLHEDHLRKMENQIVSLQTINQTKANEIQQLIREKATARTVFDNENARLKDQITVYKDKIAELDTVYTSKVKSLQNRIDEKDKQISYLQQLYRDMKSNSDSEILTLKELLSQKKSEHEKLKITARQAQQAAVQEKNTLQNEKQTLKQALKREQKEKHILKETLETTLNDTESSLRSKIQSLIAKINMIQKQNDGLKRNIQLKDKQIKTLTERLSQSDARQSKLQHEINEYRQKLLQKDRKNNEALQQQKLRLQKSSTYLIENLKSDHEAVLRVQAAKQRQFKDKLAKKDKELQNLLKMHKKMCDEVKVLTEQQANKKNIDLKFPGATADLIATKNMFDVFLKTKVLDVCGDVIASKENFPQQK